MKHLSRTALLLLQSGKSPASALEHLEPRVLLAANYGFISGPTTAAINQTPGVYADFDGDNDKDLATSSGQSDDALKVWFNDGTGAFTLNNTYDFFAATTGTFDAKILAFDSDNDGDTDILTSGLALWINNGNGTFAAGVTIPVALIARDVTPLLANNDAFLDLAMVESSGSVTFLVNSGLNTFSRGNSIAFDGTAKFAGSGLVVPRLAGPPGPFAQDLVMYVPSTQTVQALLNTDAGLVLGASITGVTTKPLALDITGDSMIDVAWTDSTPTVPHVVLARNSGLGSFLSAAELIKPSVGATSSSILGFGKFTGDNKADAFVLENTGIGLVARVFPGNGTGTFSTLLALPAVKLGAGEDATDITWGDLTNDNRDEVIVFTDPGVRVRSNTAGPTVTTFTSTASTRVVPGDQFTLQARQIQPNTIGSARRVLFFADRGDTGVLDVDDLFVGEATTSGNNADLAITWGDFGALGQPTDGARSPWGDTNFFAVAYTDDGGIVPDGDAALGPARSTLITLWTRVMYPEGWRNLRNVNEHVPMVNNNSFPVQYRVVLRYEEGERDQVVEEGILPPSFRGGITTTLRGQPQSAFPARVDTGYSFEVQTSAPVGAMLARYDLFNFGPADTNPGSGTGEAFTNISANTWSLPDMTNSTLNFILIYNPFPNTANVTLRFVSPGIQPVTLTRTVEGFRRSGSALQLESALLPGRDFSVTVTSDQPILVAKSSYEPTIGRSHMSLAQPLDGPGAVGTGTNLVLQGISFGNGQTNTAFLSNPNTTAATVDLFGTYDGSALTTTNTFTLQPGGRQAINLASLAPNGATRGTFRVTSTAQGVSAVAKNTVNTGGINSDETVTPAGTFASKVWGFGDGFLNPSALGTTYFENLDIYNPQSSDTIVTVRFLYSGDASTQVQVTVPAGKNLHLRLHQVPELIGHVGLSFFSTVVSADAPVVASLQHGDLSQPGVWGTLGSPLDAIVSLPIFLI